MFWVRPQSSRAITFASLAEGAFAPEAGRLDCATEHAVERIFNHAARAAGYDIATIDAESEVLGLNS